MADEDTSYDPTSPLNAVAQSDVPEQLAAGVEAIGRGILPKGTFNSLEKSVGGATQEQIDTRKAKGGIAADIAEGGSSIIRDAAAFTTGGAAAMYGLAALNTIGAVADEPAVNHDIGLATERVAGHLFGELMTTTFGLGVGQAAAASGQLLSKTGKAIMATSVGSGVKLLGEDLKAAGVAVGDLRKVAEQAINDGVFTRARATALEHSEKVIGEAEDHIATYLAPANATASLNPAIDNSQVRQAVQSTLEQTAKRLSPAESQGAIAKLQSLAQSFGAEEGNITPSKLLEYEAALKNAAKSETGEGATGLYGAHERVKGITDTFLNQLNTPAQELRQMQQELVAQQAIKASIPTDAMKPAAKAVGKGAIGAGLAYLGHELGLGEIVEGLVPSSLVHGAEGAVLGAVGLKHGAKALSMAGDVARSVAGGATASAYAAGQGLEQLSHFDKQFLGQYYANHVGNELGAATYSALRGTIDGSASAVVPDSAFEKLQGWAANPQSFRRAAQEHAESLPLSDEHKSDIVDQASCLLTHVAKFLPQCSPYAPAGARALPARKQRELGEALQAITQPESQIANPTRTGLDTLNVTHPKTKSTMINLILDDLGPNTPASGTARKIVDEWGGDNTLKDAGRAQQQNYIPQPAPAPRARKRGGGGNTTININETVSTPIDDIEKGTP